jgi:CheY-like chemotaxis protein
METQSSALLILVEDEALLHMEIEEALTEGGFDVKLATTATEGITLLESHKDAVRGLITDVNLGAGGNGWDLARHARSMMPELPVVYITGGNIHEWTTWGVPKSVMVEKPFALAQIVTAISTLMNAAGGQG